MDQAIEQSTERVSDDDVDAEGLEKLTALMDEGGTIPPHGEKDDLEGDEAPGEPENKADERRATEGKDPEGQTELEEVNYEGKHYKVPPELKGALLRQSDYTQKTQEVARERAAAQQERQLSARLMQEANQFVGHYAAIQQIDAQLQEMQKVDWQRLSQQDPLTELRLRTGATELIRARDGVLSQLNAARQAMSQSEMVSLAQAATKGHEQLAKDIPDWGQGTQKALRDTARSFGFSDEELSNVYDPRAVKVLHELHSARTKLAEYEKRMGIAQKQVQRAPLKPVRSSATQDRSGDSGPSATREISQLRRTGRDEDALAALSKLGLR